MRTLRVTLKRERGDRQHHHAPDATTTLLKLASGGTVELTYDAWGRVVRADGNGSAPGHQQYV